MAITYSREVLTFSLTNGTQTTALTVAGGGDIGPGRLVVIPWQNGSNNTNILAAVTDTKSNSYQVTAVNTNDANGSCGIAYGYISTDLANATDVITLHWTNTSNDHKMGAVEVFTGVNSDFVNAITAASVGTVVSNPITTVQTASLIFYAQGQEQTNVYTAAGGFTPIGQKTNNSRLDYGYKIVSSASTYDPAGSYPGSTNWFASIASFSAFSMVEDYWQNSVAVERIIQGESVITTF